MSLFYLYDQSTKADDETYRLIRFRAVQEKVTANPSTLAAAEVLVERRHNCFVVVMLLCFFLVGLGWRVCKRVSDWTLAILRNVVIVTSEVWSNGLKCGLMML